MDHAAGSTLDGNAHLANVGFVNPQDDSGEGEEELEQDKHGEHRPLLPTPAPTHYQSIPIRERVLL